MSNNPEFIRPIDGDILSQRDGITCVRGLILTVTILAEHRHELYINEKKATENNGFYTADIEVTGYANKIKAHDATTGCSQTIVVYKIDNPYGKYRLSLDDNIWFLQDIAKNSNTYRSIFENPYLAFFKEIHEQYGTKIHINIYFQTEGFNLSQMPSKYKAEWIENADWLRLSFHARQDAPDMPYKNAGYDEIKQDCEMVLEQIKRFAGVQLLGPVTTLHWGEATVEGCRALRELGYKCLVGDFNVDNVLPPVSYYLDVEKRRHINKRFIWKDNKEDIIFFRSAIIIDCHKLEHITGFLDEINTDAYKSCYLDLLIHEQYFYPRYSGYQKEYRDKVIKAVQWATEKGYRSEFLEKWVLKA